MYLNVIKNVRFQLDKMIKLQCKGFSVIVKVVMYEFRSQKAHLFDVTHPSLDKTRHGEMYIFKQADNCMTVTGFQTFL